LKAPAIKKINQIAEQDVLLKIKIITYYGISPKKHLFNFITKDFEEITLNFLIQGHTKFSCDRFFGYAKLKLKKADTVETVEDAQNLISLSSIHAKVQSFRDFDTNRKLLKIFDFKTFLQQFFKKGSSEQKFLVINFINS